MDKKSDKKIGQKIGQEIGHEIGREVGQEIGHKIEQKTGHEIGQEIGQELESESDVTARVLKELADDIAALLTWLFNQSLFNGIKFSRLAGRPSLFRFISQVPRTLRLTTEALHYFQFCLRCWRNVS